MQSRIIFITGTDTGVGKTVLTAMLLAHLRATGRRANAIKPFCSGGRADAELLYELQDGELTLDQINPFHFPEPLAPLVAARLHKREIGLKEAAGHIERLFSKATPEHFLLVEGVGGLMVPLGEGYGVLDLIQQFRCEVIVVALNKLGVINHSLLTVRTLREAGLEQVRMVLMDPGSQDASRASNPAILSEMLGALTVQTIPFLGFDCGEVKMVKKNAGELGRILRKIVLEQ